MAKSKTFASGELLTASLINTYLNPDVPNEGDPYDTGWVDIAIASGFAQQGSSKPQVRRIGNVVYARWGWNNTGISATTTTYTVGTIPVGFRPTQTSYCLSIGSSQATSGCRITVNTSGTVQVQTGTSVSSYFLFASGSSWMVN